MEQEGFAFPSGVYTSQGLSSWLGLVNPTHILEKQLLLLDADEESNNSLPISKIKSSISPEAVRGVRNRMDASLLTNRLP
jgi:hypothetical protein